MEPNDRTEQLRQIKEEIIHLKESPLYEERMRNKVFPVIGEGNHSAAIMLIGEAPGETEAKTGRPFVGAAGRVLTELIESIGLKREQVYITNIVKDRPPNNRDPLPEEIELYAPFLDRQIEIIQPKVIAPLGRFAMKYIMEKFGIGDKAEGISKIHGQMFEAKAGYRTITIIPLFHPAVAVYDADKKAVLEKDFTVLKQLKTE